jgi:hydrocephalus-inducing protein
VVPAGARQEVAFSFTPAPGRGVGSSEAFYRFSVPSAALSQLFLVVGTVVEPRVALDRPLVHFTNLLLGARSAEVVHLVNEEDEPFAFQFDVASLAAAEGGASSLRVAPDRARCRPAPGWRWRWPLRPRRSARTTSTCSRRVAKSLPLSLNIKGEGYDVHDCVRVEPAGGGDGVRASPAGAAAIDFGVVQVNECAVRR